MAEQPRSRVLFVHHRREPGGAPGSLARLISALDRTRYEPHVYCPPGSSARLFREAGAVVHTGPVAGFTHIWASYYRGRRWLLLGRELAALPRHVWALDRTLANGSFDLVHLNDSPLVAAACLARRRRIPIVWHLRSAPASGGTDHRARLLRWAISSLAATCIAINDDVASLWAVTAEIVPDPVELDRFAPGGKAAARRSLGLAQDGLVVSYVGFLYPAKGFDVLLRAAAAVRENGVVATYLIVGGGVREEGFYSSPFGRALVWLGLAHDYASEGRQLVAELGLEGVVRLEPFTPAVETIYRASDLVVAPSQGPELGLSMLEAAASGIPGIATGSRGGAGVLEPGSSTVLVDRLGSGPLAAAITGLLRDPDRRTAMGARGRELALERLDPSRGARRVEAIYERVLCTGRTVEPCPPSRVGG